MNEQYTIRVYNSNIVKKIDNLFKRTQSVYHSKNPFLVDCVIRGMEDVEKEFFGVKKIETLTEVYDEIQHTIEKLDKLIKKSEKSSKENLAYLNIIQKLMSSNYNMLIGLSEGYPKSKEFVENGMLDDLPKRLEILLEVLLKDKKE